MHKTDQAKIEELEKVILCQTVVIEVLYNHKDAINTLEIIVKLKEEGILVSFICKTLSKNRSNY